MRIAVLCSDRVALPAIDQLLTARLVVAIAMPDRQHEIQVIIKQRCDHYKVPFQLFNKKNLKEQIMNWLDQYQPDVVLVKTFPFLIPCEAITRPKYGFINFHYAPLPEWRGPNPLFWMIRNQATAGGVTVHRMNAMFDEGPVLMEQKVTCTSDTDFGLFYTQLGYAGAHLTGSLLYGLRGGTLQEKEQDHSQAKWYRKPVHADLVIDWATMDASEIKALVKACNPWNKGAVACWKGWSFGITYASIGENFAANEAEPGTVLSADATKGFTIATCDGKVIKAEIVYCEEGFYPGHCMSQFGLQKNEKLS
jgi:methionyl-tRNA formyltransferase